MATSVQYLLKETAMGNGNLYVTLCYAFLETISSHITKEGVQNIYYIHEELMSDNLALCLFSQKQNRLTLMDDNAMPSIISLLCIIYLSSSSSSSVANNDRHLCLY